MKRAIASISILLLLFVFTFTPLTARPPVDTATAADALYLEKEIVYSLDADGGWTKEYGHSLQLNTYQAFSRFCGETFIPYNPRFQELKVLKSETTMRDGKKVASPSNAYNEVLPRDAHYFSYYSDLREMVVTHTGLECGAVIDIRYTLKTKPGFLPYFSGRDFIADRFPTRKFVLKVIVPADKELRYQLFHIDLKPEIQKDNGMTTYTFTASNPGSFLEEPLNDSASRSFIVFSTADKWEDVFPSLDDAGPVPPELLKKAGSAKTGSGSDIEFLFKLQEMVADHIDNCKIGMDLNGFALRTFQEATASNYGTAIEKAYLLYSLLDHFNFQPEIAAIPIDNQPAPEVPTLFQFHNYLVKVNIKNGGPVYLNPWENGEHLFPYQLTGASVYNLKEKAFQVIQAVNAAGETGNRVDISGQVTVGKEKTTGELNIILSGYFFPYRSALGDSKAAILKVLKGILPVSSLEVKTITMLTPGKVMAGVSIEGNFLKDLYQQRRIIEKFSFPYLKGDMTWLEQRNYPLYLNVPCDFRVKLEFHLPEDLAVVYREPSIDVEEGAAYYRQKVESPKPGIIDIEMAVGIKNPIVSPTDYPGFKKALNLYFTKEALVIVKQR